jgi:hypothetical protein
MAEIWRTCRCWIWCMSCSVVWSAAPSHRGASDGVRPPKRSWGRQPSYLLSFKFLKKKLSSTYSYSLQTWPLTATYLWTTLPSQGPQLDALSSPLPPQHEVPTPVSLPCGRPLPVLLLSTRHSAPPHVTLLRAPTSRSHPPRPSWKERQGRPAPPVPWEAYAYTYACAPIHLALSVGRGNLRHCSSTPGRSWPCTRMLCFQVFQAFQTYVSSV